MANYALEIREHNKQAHIDIEDDIQARKNGLFTFTIRVNKGNIVDYVTNEYITAREKYLSLRKVVIQELTVTHNIGERSKPDTIRTTDIQCGVERGSSDNNNLEYSQEQKKEI